MSTGSLQFLHSVNSSNEILEQELSAFLSFVNDIKNSGDFPMKDALLLSLTSTQEIINDKIQKKSSVGFLTSLTNLNGVITEINNDQSHRNSVNEVLIALDLFRSSLVRSSSMADRLIGSISNDAIVALQA